MPMNKKEQAEMTKLRDELDYAFALSWPQDSPPVPMTRDEIKALQPNWGTVVRGWFYNAYVGSFSSQARVTEGCSDGIYHSTDRTDKTSTQGMGRMYRTKLEAITAARWDLCRQFAKILANLDQQRFSELAAACLPSLRA